MEKETDITAKPSKKVVEAAAEPVKNAVNGIIVGDPLILKPVDLPLVVKPESGAWANDAQAEFAKTINAYAYSNPEKWNIKKDALIKQLLELENDPNKLFVFRGERVDGISGNVSFKNNITQK